MQQRQVSEVVVVDDGPGQGAFVLGDGELVLARGLGMGKGLDEGGEGAVGVVDY